LHGNSIPQIGQEQGGNTLGTRENMKKNPFPPPPKLKKKKKQATLSA
jgi:hypothetical protein